MQKRALLSSKRFDFIVIGSGFGGSVAAYRLVLKGYSVLVLESGRRFTPEDFPKSNWNIRRFLFMPRLGLQGIMRLDFFKGLLVLSGAGLGGGSLVYANTLIEPTDEAFADANWPDLLLGSDGSKKPSQTWRQALAPFYQEAKRMLGVVSAPTNFPADLAVKQVAESLGYGDSFHNVGVGVFFGSATETVRDPYFNGAGPDRVGCNLCGGCMIGCKHGAKNTLDKNYLYLAEKSGVTIKERCEVSAITPATRGYVVTCKRPGIFGNDGKQVYYADQVVLAAGVIGTLKLLLRCRDQIKTLPLLSRALGTSVRTNSESIIGVRVGNVAEDYSLGLAITSGVNPDTHTKIEAVRYPAGSDFMGLLVVPLLEAKSAIGRLLAFCKFAVNRPLRLLKGFWPFGFAKETIILLVMQSLDNKMGFRWRQKSFSPFSWLGGNLRADYGKDDKGRPPVSIPAGNQFAHALAKKLDGDAGSSVTEMLGMSMTAHILGGCPMGSSDADGVISSAHEIFGYPGLFVVGGAAVPANLGVNPSLTITAMAERAMSLIQAKAAVKDLETATGQDAA